MSDLVKALAAAKNALEIESSALNKLTASIENNLRAALELIVSAQGHIAVTGLGKSGIVGKKISATLSSVGTESFFIHSADALHGDSGSLEKKDLLIAISNSGSTAEVLAFAQMAKSWGVKLVSITSNPNSQLAKLADANIDISFEREADPNGLAPTTSTTLTLAVGDALAAALVTFKNFSAKDFKERHPGGTLGGK